MKKIKLAVIFGGESSEYEVSLKSASSVIQNIDNNKYDVYLIGVTKLGNFLLYNGKIENILNDTWSNGNTESITISVNKKDHGFIKLKTNELVKIDLVFSLIHGKNGEDGTLQGLLCLAGIPYVGSSLLSSALCMNKYMAHEIAKLNNIKVPNSFLFNKESSKEDIKKSISILKLPVFIKPLRAGSSFGINKLTNLDDLDKCLKEAFKYDDKIVIEEEIKGFEVGCAIIGNKDLIVSEVDEISLDKGFFDYDKKYKKATSSSIIPATLNKEEREKIKCVAKKLYQILDCKDYARVDMFYTIDKEIVFNEINTIPGFTTHSRFPLMLNYIGYNFKDIIEKLIKMALDNE